LYDSFIKAEHGLHQKIINKRLTEFIGHDMLEIFKTAEELG